MTEQTAALLEEVAEHTAVCLRRLNAPATPGSQERGSREWFPAASVIKVGIMSCLLDAVERGQKSLTDRVSISTGDMVGGAGVLLEMEPRDYTLGELCRLMMVVSDNTASNACLRAVTMEGLNRFFQARGYQAEVQRYFMSPVVDERDNRMTAEAAALMLVDLYSGKELSSELRDFAVGCLRRQQYREKLPLLLPEDVPVGHKTGELDGVRHDAAVVELENPYVVVIFTEKGREPWLVDQAMAIRSRQIFDAMEGVLS